jgi:hypothetical protein
MQWLNQLQNSISGQEKVEIPPRGAVVVCAKAHPCLSDSAHAEGRSLRQTGGLRRDRLETPLLVYSS